jgi:hypothetical protein
MNVKSNFFVNAAIALFIILLPWQTSLIWRQTYLNSAVWEYGRLSLYISELFLWALLVIFAVHTLASHSKIDLQNWKSSILKNKIPNASYWLMVGLVLIAGLSVWWAYDFSIAYHLAIRLLALAAMTAVILISDISFRVAAWAWVFSGSVQSLIAVWQFFNQYIGPAKWFGIAEHISNIGGSIVLQTPDERWLRAYGSLPHPNILGGMLFVGLLFCLYLGVTASKKYERWLAMAGVIIMTPGLFFTFSRSAWLALILAVIIFAMGVFLQRRSDYWKTFGVMAGTIFLMMIILTGMWWGAVTTRINADQNLEIASLELRVAFVQQAATIIQQLPWQGTGLGNYTLGVYYLVFSDWPGYYYQPVHNLFLLVLAELGIFGIIFWSAWVGLLLYGGVRKLIDLKTACLLAIFCGFLLIGLVDHYFWTIYTGMAWFWLIAAFLLKFSSKKAV